MINKELIGGHNIFVYHNFLSKEDCEEYIKFIDFSLKEKTEKTATTAGGVFGVQLDIPIISNDESKVNQEDVNILMQRFKEATEDLQGMKVTRNSFHALKWETESYGDYHSDNSELDGEDNGNGHNLFSTILYLNDDYLGGELHFRDHNFDLKLDAGCLLSFPGGIKNIHKIKDVLQGNRYNIVSFWNKL